MMKSLAPSNASPVAEQAPASRLGHCCAYERHISSLGKGVTRAILSMV